MRVGVGVRVRVRVRARVRVQVRARVELGVGVGVGVRVDAEGARGGAPADGLAECGVAREGVQRERLAGGQPTHELDHLVRVRLRLRLKGTG